MKKIISALLTIAFILALPLNIYAGTPSLSDDTKRENLAQRNVITHKTCPNCSGEYSFRWYCHDERDILADPVQGGTCYVPSHGEGCGVTNKILYLTYGVCVSCHAGDPRYYSLNYRYPYACVDTTTLSYINHSESCNHINTGDTVYNVCIYYHSVYDVLDT